MLQRGKIGIPYFSVSIDALLAIYTFCIFSNGSRAVIVGNRQTELDATNNFQSKARVSVYTRANAYTPIHFLISLHKTLKSIKYQKG